MKTEMHLSSNIQWNDLLKKSAGVIASKTLDGALEPFIAIDNLLSNICGIASTPINFTFGEGGYVKGKVSARIYDRSVYIEDKLNRIPNDSYYYWGHVEAVRTFLSTESETPIDIKNDGTVIYKHNSLSDNRGKYIATLGYYGGTGLFEKIIRKYENLSGYFTYDETINIHDLTLKLLQ